MGGLGAQAVQFLAIPVLARLYTPEDFAFWALCLAGLLLFGTIAAFRYELALMIPKGHQEASDLFWGAVLLVFGMSVLGGSLLAMPCPRRLLGIETITPGLAALLFGGGILIQGTMLLLTNWANRQECFGLNAMAQIALAVVAVGFQIAWILLGGCGSWGLILGFVAGQGTSVVVTATGLLVRGKLPASASGSMGIVKAMLEQYRFPIFSTPRTLCGLARDRGTVVVLEQHVARVDVGGYAVVQRLINFPVSLVASAVRPVLYSRMAKDGIAANEGCILAIQRFIVLVATPWLAIVMLTADQLAPLILGSQWGGAGDLIRVLVWPYYLMMFVIWLDRIMDIGSRQMTAFWLEAGFAIASVVALWTGLAMTGALLVGVVAQAVVLTIYALTLWVVYYKLSALRIVGLAKIVALMVSLFLLTYAAIWAIFQLLPTGQRLAYSIMIGIIIQAALFMPTWKTLKDFSRK